MRNIALTDPEVCDEATRHFFVVLCEKCGRRVTRHDF